MERSHVTLLRYSDAFLYLLHVFVLYFNLSDKINQSIIRLLEN